MNKQLMFIGIAVLLICVGLSGCESLTEAKGICYYDFELTEEYYAGYYSVASEGYKFIIVTLSIKNEAEQYVSTNAYHWKLNANSIEYGHSVATYDEGIDHQTVEVNKGGTFGTTIVFEIPDDIGLDACSVVPNKASFSRVIDFKRDDSLI